MTKNLLELDVTGHNMGNDGAAALGAALRKNRSVTTLSYDRNQITLEGFKAIRGCLYGNKKLINVSAPAVDYAVRIRGWAVCFPGRGVSRYLLRRQLYPGIIHFRPINLGFFLFSRF